MPRRNRDTEDAIDAEFADEMPSVLTSRHPTAVNREGAARRAAASAPEEGVYVDVTGDGGYRYRLYDDGGVKILASGGEGRKGEGVVLRDGAAYDAIRKELEKKGAFERLARLKEGPPDEAKPPEIDLEAEQADAAAINELVGPPDVPDALEEDPMTPLDKNESTPEDDESEEAILKRLFEKKRGEMSSYVSRARGARDGFVHGTSDQGIAAHSNGGNQRRG